MVQPTAPHGRSPAPPEGSGMLGVGTGEIGGSATPPLLPCRSHASANCAPRSAARPSAHRLIAPCDISVLPFASQVKNRTGPPPLDRTLKSEVTFCVQGVTTPPCGVPLSRSMRL